MTLKTCDISHQRNTNIRKSRGMFNDCRKNAWYCGAVGATMQIGTASAIKRVLMSTSYKVDVFVAVYI